MWKLFITNLFGLLVILKSSFFITPRWWRREDVSLKSRVCLDVIQLNNKLCLLPYKLQNKYAISKVCQLNSIAIYLICCMFLLRPNWFHQFGKLFTIHLCIIPSCKYNLLISYSKSINSSWGSVRLRCNGWHELIYESSILSQLVHGGRPTYWFLITFLALYRLQNRVKNIKIQIIIVSRELLFYDWYKTFSSSFNASAKIPGLHVLRLHFDCIFFGLHVVCLWVPANWKNVKPRPWIYLLWSWYNCTAIIPNRRHTALMIW